MNEEKEKERQLGFGVSDWGAARANDDKELTWKLDRNPGPVEKTPARLGHPP